MAVVTAAVIAAGAGIYAANQSGKAAKDQQAAAQGLYNTAAKNPGGYFGTIPEEVEYSPLYMSDPGYANIAGQTISGDRRNLKNAQKLSSGINKGISADALTRIQGWDPTFTANQNQLQYNRDLFSAGQLPYQDAQGIVSDRGRLANDMGQAGGSRYQTAADLGLARVDLMSNTGPGLAQSIAAILNQVDPISRHTTSADYLLTPSQTVPWAIQENQFGATFQANQNVIQAQADPGLAGLLGLQGFQAGFAGTSARNNAAMGSAVAQGFSGIAGAYGGGSGAGFASMFGGGAGAPQAGATYQAPTSWQSPSFQTHGVSQRPAGI